MVSAKGNDKWPESNADYTSIMLHKFVHLNQIRLQIVDRKDYNVIVVPV